MDNNQLDNSNNSRIAKNTFLLYIRMFVMMAIALFTSRVVIQSLGVDDYGIYNLIGGVIVLLSFINQAMTNASQRFISYELGKGDYDSLKRTFMMSLNCHIIIALILVVLAETLGLWFINEKLNIPENRMLAANFVYQFSVVNFVTLIIRVPYSSTIISYERMSFYAYITIIEAILNLSVAFIISYTSKDKLIVYSGLLALAAIIINAAFIVYCIKSFGEVCRFRYLWDKPLFKKIIEFSSWSMVNGGANIISQHGGSILINIYNGVIANAAYGIANQVSGAVYTFVSNFQTAFRPQIIKQYAAGKHNELKILINRSSLFSYYLLLIIVSPFYVGADEIIKLWLGTVPQFSVGFCYLMLLFFLIDAVQAPLWMLIYATGDIKVYTIWSGLITILNIPISWLLLHNGFSVYYVFVVRVLLNLICSIIRIWHIWYFVKYPAKEYIKEVVIRCAIVTVLVATILYVLLKLNIIQNIVLLIAMSLILTLLIVWFIGINKTDKKLIISMASNYITKSNK